MQVPSLRLIALASTGYDATDVAAADRLGIAVTNSQGTLHETTADLALDHPGRAGDWVK